MVLNTLSISAFYINTPSLSIWSFKALNVMCFNYLWWQLRVLSGGPHKPPLFKGACPHALAVISDWFAYKVQGHSSTIGMGASWKAGAFHVGVAGWSALQSDMGVFTHFTPPIMFSFGLACHDPVQWVVAFLFWSTIHQHQWVIDIILCLMYVFLPRSAAKSLYLWSSPILSGCSSRCPQSKLQLPIFPPQGSFTGRSSGNCLAISSLVVSSHHHPLWR